MKTVIGIIGPIGSGKDEIAKYLTAKLKIPIYQISQFLKKVAKERNIKPSRKNLIELGTKIAQEKGGECLAKVILDKIKNKGIITGMRHLEQITHLKKCSRLILIAVDAEPLIRFKRAKFRNKPGEPKTLKEFIRNEQRENSPPHAQRLFECMKLADYHIENNSTLSDLHKKLDDIIIKGKLI